MTQRLPSALLPWDDEGKRIAPMLVTTAAIVVTGHDMDATARVALGIALEERKRRHVALGDLAGDLQPIYAVAGGEDAAGLSDCFRDGRTLNDIARPAPDLDQLFILPAGTPPVGTADVLTHERWPKLVAGFAQMGALLILVARADAPGIDALIARTDGAVLVDADDVARRGVSVIAAVARPQMDSGARLSMKVLIGAALVFGLFMGAMVVLNQYVKKGRPTGRPTLPVVITAPPPTAQATPPALVDTIFVSEPAPLVNPSTSAFFAVEVIAANTSSGANSVLQESQASTTFPAPTVSPVQPGGARRWYKAVVGAWHARAAADSSLGAWRAAGIVRAGTGVVVRVPYAVLLADSIAPNAVAAQVSSWRTRGIAAYALEQDDGVIRIVSGAFETAAQAAPLAASVRDAGTTPVVVFRTGRTF